MIGRLLQVWKRLREADDHQRDHAFVRTYGRTFAGATVGIVGLGSIGRALGYSEGGGLGLYRDAVALLENLPGLDVAGVHKLADGVARDKTGEAFQTVGDLVRWWVHRTIEGQVRGSVSASAGGLDRWFEVWEKNNRLFERADSVNLDHKQVILNAFAAIDAAHSSS